MQDGVKMRINRQNVLASVVAIILILFLLAKIRNAGQQLGTTRMEFEIRKTWDGIDLTHKAVRVKLKSSEDGHDLIISVDAPFFNDPANPGGAVGKPFPQLWDYEVVEAFFLNDRGSYLEVELCPHGQHLLLMLQGVRNMKKDKLEIDFKHSLEGDTWTGEAIIPGHYLPAKVSKFNAYAIHGSGKDRIYESLYPVHQGEFKDPDFHRLEYFHSIDFKSVLPSNWGPEYTSNEWKQILLN